MNLNELLNALSDLDSAPNVEFDPETIIGDLREKVDGVHAVMGRLKMEAARLSEISESFKRASKQVEANLSRLESYVVFTMTTQGFQKIPGNHWRLQLQKSTPALIVDRGAMADDMLSTPAFVTRKVEYAWDKNAIKEHLANGGNFSYGHVVESMKPRFYVNKGAEK